MTNEDNRTLFQVWWDDHCLDNLNEKEFAQAAFDEGLKKAFDLCGVFQTHKDELLKICEDMINKMDEITADPQFKALFFHARNHGMEYNGPQYGEELEALRKIVNKIKGEK